MTSELAVLGGPKAVQIDPGDLFTWPIISRDAEEAVLAVLRAGRMSHLEVTLQFEKEYAAWLGMSYALAHNTGTASLHSAMFGLGIGAGDEIICPSVTYWASCLPVYSLGGTVVFTDIDPVTLCIDPNDIEQRITSRTKAIVVVHYTGYPCEMDTILAIARRHKIAVIEDCSHAHGALYKGRLVGTMGDVACFSLMTGKSFPIGEGGIMVTNNRMIYERAALFGHYERAAEISDPELAAGAGLPWGGYKYRMHQLSSAVGRVQLKEYPQRMAEIDRSMNHFWDLLQNVPGIRPHRPPRGSGLTMGGWYFPVGLYRPEELAGLSVARFVEALAAEGVPTGIGCNRALHLHPLFNTVDVYHQGRPTRIANLPAGVDVRQPAGSLPVAEKLQEHVFQIPWFKQYRPAAIEEYAAAVRKVVRNHGELLAGDRGMPDDGGEWGLSRRR